jgi:hypothetical protein
MEVGLGVWSSKVLLSAIEIGRLADPGPASQISF